ncbi:hypothetical protein J6590_077930 [Homalodisca vitripennis]|nr:hypothetical protein J6590_077930 [Homalodisca vitripennis]
MHGRSICQLQTEAISTWLGDSCHNVNIPTRLSQLLQPCTSAEVNNGALLSNFMLGRSICQLQTEAISSCYSSLSYLQELIIEPLLSNFIEGRSICQQQTEAISSWLGDSCHNVNIPTRLSQLLQPCTSAEVNNGALFQLLQPCISAEVNNGALLSNFMHGRSMYQQQTEAISSWLGDSCHNVNILTRLSQLLQPCTSAEVNNGALLSNFMHGRSIYQPQTEAISSWLGDSCHNVNILTRLSQLLQPCTSAEVNNGPTFV